MIFCKALLLVTVVCVGMTVAPALAQSTNAGPVHFPAPSTADPSVAPAPAIATPVAAPDANLAAAPAATPIVSTPIQVPASTQSDVSGDIHDIRGVIAIPYEWPWAAYLLAGLIAMGLIYAAVRFFRGRIKTKEKMPFELALDLLDEAYKQLKSEEITVREYAFLASEIIRLYIEQRFGEKAARRTSEEFLSDLLAQTNTPLAQRRDLLENFLNHCDLIKFARWGASERELESMHESARAFILDTRPQPETAPKPTQPVLAQVK